MIIQCQCENALSMTVSVNDYFGVKKQTTHQNTKNTFYVNACSVYYSNDLQNFKQSNYFTLFTLFKAVSRIKSNN